MDDFGTGLRAHLGLERVELEVAAVPVTSEPADAADEDAEPDLGELEALARLESELAERERLLVQREAALAGRAGSLLAAAQALYDEVLGGAPSPDDDELARLRRRKSVA